MCLLGHILFNKLSKQVMKTITHGEAHSSSLGLQSRGSALEDSWPLENYHLKQPEITRQTHF